MGSFVSDGCVDNIGTLMGSRVAGAASMRLSGCDLGACCAADKPWQQRYVQHFFFVSATELFETVGKGTSFRR